MINNIFTFGIRCVDSDISYEDMIIRERNKFYNHFIITLLGYFKYF